tara:strand:+ start:2106 stop:3356 length:1251 start_codon:yes stop_codon:yes gene_type:complete
MKLLSVLNREVGHLTRSKFIVLCLLATLIMSGLAVYGGQQEVNSQLAIIAELIELNDNELKLARAEQSDWGGLAYSSFHLVYDEPSSFAFAALGQRENEPWKHRVRALALEGQIYERDVGNPVLALVGSFDFAFFGGVVLPLLLIVLLHDLKSQERESRRLSLLVASSGAASSPFRLRAILIALLVALASAVPLVLGALLSGASMTTMGASLLVLVLNVGFWSYLCYAVANKEQASATLLGQLLGIWVVLVIVVPTTGRLFIQYAVPVPSGADIQMTQREAVNDAWDLPKEVTMQAFVERHPEWGSYSEVTQPFEWKWYYAFQQVGDQTAEPLSRAYMEGRSSRDQWGWVVAALSPPALFERVYQTLAETDMASQLSYEMQVRQFHKRLRHFYYPRLFLGEPFDPEQTIHTPLFQQ